MRGRHVFGCYIGHLTVMCLLAAVSGSCGSSTPATEVMLVIDADAKARTLGLEVQVEIEGFSADSQPDGMPSARAFHPKEPSAPPWPLELSISPRGGDAQRSYLITATLLDNQGKIAVLRARSGFVPQKTIELRLVFGEDCLNVASISCGNTETCFQGNCVPALIDASELPSYPSNLDGSDTAADGGAADNTTSSSKAPAVMSATPNGAGGSKAANSGKAGSGMQQGAGGAGGMSGMGESGSSGEQDDPDAHTPGDCGDGRRNEGELCDTAIPAGEKGACPTECKPTDLCKPEQLEGSGCQTHCVAYPIMQIDAGDGCCPPGADAKDDSDCGALCGNGAVEAGESCDPSNTCPTVDSCQNAEVCLHASIAGDASTCNVKCVMEPISACASGDGCCPSECTHDNDSDCSTSCGDGVVDPAAGERCEPNSPTLPCPASCDDGDACTTDFSTGSPKNCNVFCSHVPVLLPIIGDGCCPAGANANADLDCKPTCGNGIVEIGERCDGRCPTAADCNDNNPCTRDAVEGSGCNVRCTHTLINVAMANDQCCPQGANANNDSDCKPFCGNGIKEAGETCDGSDCPPCTDNDPCTRDVRVGGMCNPTACNHELLAANRNQRDGCCPMGADSSTDRDCSNAPQMCGDGKKDPGEMCDPCPTTCADDGDKCTTDELEGTGCNVVCAHKKITEIKPDGCCVMGEDKSTELACMNAPPPPPAKCGDNHKDPDETCDGDCPTSCDDNNSCTKDVLSGVATSCNVKCSNTPITEKNGTDGCCVTGEDSSTDPSCKNAPPPKCGDNHKDPGETCDGDCPTSCNDADPCTEDMLLGSASACTAECKHSPVSVGPKDSCCPSGREEWEDKDCSPRCGNGHVEPGEECDETSNTCNNLCQRVTAPPPPEMGMAGSAAP